MESTTSKPYGPTNTNPPLSVFSFVHHHCARLGAEFATRLEDTKCFAGALAGNFHSAAVNRRLLYPPPIFASLSQPKQVLAAKIGADYVAKTLVGTKVYTVSNSDNEFVLISDPSGSKSIGLLCFRKEDAEALLSQVRARKRELRSVPRVVPVGLDQIYNLNIEGIAFRFLPDPLQLRNALELKAGKVKDGFDGVPVFQSDLLRVKRNKKRYCPVYFQKEDLENELLRLTKVPRGGISQHIMVGSLEDVLRKMETSERNSGWEDLIFIPPGKSHSQHIQEVVKA